MTTPSPPWFQWALGQLGVSEIPGPKDNPHVLAYRKVAHMGGLAGSEEAVAWCSVFVCAAMESVGIRSPRQALARSWMHWGIPLDKPRGGCVVVLWRGSRSGSLGHVGLLRAVSADGRFVCLLGGNQGNRVSMAWFPVERVLGYRWPTAGPGVPAAPTAKAPVLDHGKPARVAVSEV